MATDIRTSIEPRTSSFSSQRSSERGTTSADQPIAQNTVRKFASASPKNGAESNSGSDESTPDDLASMQTLLDYVKGNQTDPVKTITLNGVTFTMTKSTQSDQSESQTVVVKFISNNEAIGLTFSETIDVETLKSNISMLQKNMAEPLLQQQTPSKLEEPSAKLEVPSKKLQKVS